MGKVGWRVSEPDRTASYAARLGSGQIAGVGAGSESHRRGVDCFLRVGGDIVEETVSGGKVVLGGVCLIRGKLANSSEDREVKCYCIEEQGSNHWLDPSLFCGREWSREGGGGR